MTDWYICYRCGSIIPERSDCLKCDKTRVEVVSTPGLVRLTERGWWTFSWTGPTKLTDSQLEHISIQIKEGYREGEIHEENKDI